MDLIHSSIKTFSANEEIRAIDVKHKYPFLIIFEGYQSLRIFNLEDKTGCETHNRLYNFDQTIVETTLQDYYLWLILKSGETIVIDLYRDKQIKIIIDNYSVLRFGQIQENQDDFVLISESGDHLFSPYSKDELRTFFEKEVSEVTINLKKTELNDVKLIRKPYVTICGLQLTVDDGILKMYCPITGLVDTLNTEVKLTHILTWEDMVILSDEIYIWLVDLKELCVSYEFVKLDMKYLPVASFNKTLFYLLWNKDEFQICCAKFASSTLSELNGTQDLSSHTSQSLSSQEQFKLQLKGLVEDILASNKQVQVTDIMLFFEKIYDLEFLLNNAKNLCQNNIIYKSILYVLQKRILSAKDDNLIYTVSDLINKIDLLEYIQFRGNSNYIDLNFFGMSFKDLYMTFLSKSDLDIASICWLKYAELKLTITAQDIADIVNAIPYNTKMGAMIIWLRNFIPPLFEQNPFYLDILVRWATERVFILEKSGYWPKIGLKFVEDIIQVLQSSLKTISIRPISMDDLDVLQDRIIYIIELKEKYRINLLLNELSCQSPSEVALIMLRRCYTEDLEAFLRDYLPSYSTRHLFTLDETLRSFIESEAASSGGGIDGTRLQIVLKAFHSQENKLDCLLQVLKVLDVPWSSKVEELAINITAAATKDFTISDTDRILAHEVLKEVSYAKVKVVLKKYNFPFTCTNYILVLHKIVNSPHVELEDLKTVTTVMSTYTNYGNILYVTKCLRDNETRAALQYFNNLTTNEKNMLLKTVITKYEQISESNSRNEAVERNYLDFIKGTQKLQEHQMTNIEKLYQFKNSYNIKLNMNSIYNETVCSHEVHEWLQKDQALASSGQGGNVAQLETRIGCMPLLTLLRKTSTTLEVRTFIENLLKYQNINTESNKDQPARPVLSQFKNGQNTSLLIESSCVLVELVSKCSEESLHVLMACMSMINALINTQVTIKNLTVAWKFNYIFLPLSSGDSINELIDYVETHHLKENQENYLMNICNKCDIIPFRILSNAIVNQSHFDKNAHDWCELPAKRLLSKVIASQELDELMLTSLLVVSRSKVSEEDEFWVTDILRGQNDILQPRIIKFLSTPAIRNAFGIDTNLQAETVSFPPQYILKTKFNINLTDIALPENSEETWDVKVILFYVLRQYPNTSFERLTELCNALNVSVNDGLSLQLIAVLTTWELQYKTFNDELGSRQVTYHNNDNELLSKCNLIWESIDNKDFLKDVLKDFWRNGEITLHGRVVSVNPYYYEVYLSIYNLISNDVLDTSSVKDYYLLIFLKEYRRKSMPKQYEFELFSVKGVFPEIGYFRLPFQLFMREDMWSNLKSEITLETYESWLPIVSLLLLNPDSQTSKDMICSNALKQTMTTRKRPENSEADGKETEPWRLTTSEEPLLRAAHKCVKHIANMEWAGACLFYVLQGCTRGADQVAAAQLCYQFAQRWAALQPGNRAVRQMERLHSTLSTRHALYKVEWACEELLRLSTEPAQLIRALYLHPDFVHKISRHDINRAANEIADKNGINISSIRIQILENILERATEENKNESAIALNNRDLLTAKYILKATCSKMGAIYLSRIAFDDESDFNKSKKLRALQCLMSVVESETAVKVTNREREELWMTLIELLCVVKLESIDMPWTVGIFIQNKMHALKQLIQAADGNVSVLRVAAELSSKFGTSDIIRDLIPHLMRAGLYEEMIPLLLKIVAPLDGVICGAWRAVILAPFKLADYPITERQRIKCLNAINLLPICPIIKDEDLKEIWKNCVRCKSFGLGCLILPYMTAQVRQTLIEFQKIDRRNLIASLKNLHTETYLVSGAMHVIESMAAKYR